MKAIAINGSPNKEKGNTFLIAKPFLQGLKDSGVEVEYFNSYDLDIKSCQGCNKCLCTPDNFCSVKDDMEILRSKLFRADFKIFISPLYAGLVSANLKNIIDRMYPCFWSFLKIEKGRTGHYIKDYFNPGKFVFVSSCGNYEKDNFNCLINYLDFIASSVKSGVGGCLIRPHAAALKFRGENYINCTDVYEAAYRGGKELVEKGSIRKETLDIVSRDLLPKQDFINIVNDYFKEFSGFDIEDV